MTHSISHVVSDESLSRIIDIESAGNPLARASTSSATGLGQFVNGTWLDALKDHRPDLFNGPPFDDELALRTEPSIAIELLARHTEDNAAALGAGCADGDLYLAHFAGVGTATKLLRAQPSTPCEKIFSARAIAANRSILQGKNAGQVRAWAARKMAKARTHWVAHFQSLTAAAEDAPAAEPDPGDLTATEKDGERLPPGQLAEDDSPVADPPELAMAEVRAFQTVLKGIGYHEIGLCDGIIGSRTVAAVSAFQHDRYVPITGQIDAATRQALRLAEYERWTRPIAPERANGQPEGSRIVESSERSATIGGGGAAIGGGGLLAWVAGKFDATRELLSSFEPLVKPLASVAAEYWWAFLVAGGVYVFFKSAEAREARIEDHRTGKTT